MRGQLSNLARLAGIALVVLLVYGNSVENAFHYDDFHSLVENPHIRSLVFIPLFFSDPKMFSGQDERAMYRPLLLCTYAGNYAINQLLGRDGYDVRAYHWVNMALHTANAWLVFGLGAALGLGGMGAMLAALYFVVHPLQSEAVNYISSRSEILVAFFYLLGLWVFIRGYGQTREGTKALGWSVIALGGYGASLLSKAVGITFPAVVWLATQLQVITGVKKKRWLWLYVFGTVLITGLYLIAVKAHFEAVGRLGESVLMLAGLELGSGSNAMDPAGRPFKIQLLTQIKALVYYIFIAVMPIRLTVEHTFFEARRLTDPSVWSAILFFVSSGVVWWKIPMNFRVIKFLGGAALLVLMPTMLVPLNVLVNEHRLYLPMALLSIALVWCLVRWPPQKGIAWSILLLGIFCLSSNQRNKVWQDEISLWEDAVDKAPEMYRSNMHLGGALMAQGRTETALPYLKSATLLAPQVVEAHYNLGNALQAKGDLGGAQKSYERSLALNPQFVPSLVNLAALHQDLKEYKVAERFLLKAEAVDFLAVDIKRRLGLIYGLQKRWQQAEQKFMTALKIDSQCSTCYYNLANVYFDQKRYVVAIEAYKKALIWRPDDVDAWYNLGDTYLHLGYFKEAEQTFVKGLRQIPTQVNFYYGLARAQDGQGNRAQALANYRRFLPYARKWPGIEERILQRLQEQ